MEIKLLKHYDAADQGRLGGFGYTSTMKYQVRKAVSDSAMSIHIERIPLAEPYVKEWQVEADDFELYEKMIPLGYSYGTYIEDQLVGVAITEPQRWNNTLMLWNLHIAENYRRSGMGSKLLKKVIGVARDAGFRAVTLETQNTNAPAIALYKRCGFDIEAVDLSLYSNSDVDDGEVAFYMKHYIS
ncbi:hypothetical protein BVG16_27050 [Paenibacillus selenitireducens]|uniref:N-acetyltransferase domain-containing protein n=1 Tax=Paenibacillus selenitireducens TaxID=1324314 RepID=A0A1T2X1I0_9BACL|nr:GNAT family N-acetyltransferase [Paenibacillus selenitireducens]OPA73748.1 hypothetical protein BVG16_27050 [Paenibacillus selenitireducens]